MTNTNNEHSSNLIPPDVMRLLKELKAARLAIRKMKNECNKFDEGYAISLSALRRINVVLKFYRDARWS